MRQLRGGRGDVRVRAEHRVTAADEVEVPGDRAARRRLIGLGLRREAVVRSEDLEGELDLERASYFLSRITILPTRAPGMAMFGSVGGSSSRDHASQVRESSPNGGTDSHQSVVSVA
jgi:hypothetical protein